MNTALSISSKFIVSSVESLVVSDFCLLTLSRIGKSIDIGSRSVEFQGQGRGAGDWEVTDNKYNDFWGVFGNVLELVVQQSEYAKNHWIINIKMVYFYVLGIKSQF